MKKKKTFQSESLRRLVLLERLVWLIPHWFLFVESIRKKRQVVWMRLAFFVLLLSCRVRSFFLASQTCSFYLVTTAKN